MSLNNLATRLVKFRPREEALEAAQEASDRYRVLVEQSPDTFSPNMAMSLSNLANHLSGLGRQEDALKAAREAVTIRRKLAQQYPDTFTPDLAGSLNNLAGILFDLGLRENARKIAQESNDLYRELVAYRPDAFTPDFVISLGTLGDILKKNPDTVVDACSCFAEAIEYITPVFLRIPGAFRQLIIALSNGYSESCEIARIPPDQRLLQPIVRKLREGERNDE